MAALDYIPVDPWDEQEEEPKIYYITCKYCGQKGLQWTKDNGKWRLIDIRWEGNNFIHKLHICKQN